MVVVVVVTGAVVAVVPVVVVVSVTNVIVGGVKVVVEVEGVRSTCVPQLAKSKATITIETKNIGTKIKCLINFQA